jgi:uncharacterized membrane protein (DUF4010 family)
MEDIYSLIPPHLVSFVLVTVFSLLIGLSQHKVHMIDHRDPKTFGTDRTFTFIGILGYILTLFDPVGYTLFIMGGGVIAVFFAIYYFFHLKNDSDYGITTILIGLITYCLGPLMLTQPVWMVLMVVVTVLLLAEMKETFTAFSEKMGKDEFITLAKFLIIAGIILPVVPDKPLFPGFTLSPYKIWLAVVVVSSVSYASYLLKKFVVKKNSILLAGILGGLYSSTATTIILAKRSRKEPEALNQYIAAIFFATAMMFLRVMVLIIIFNLPLFLNTWHWFVILFGITSLVGIFILFHKNRTTQTVDNSLPQESNPLEFKAALIFTGMFVLLSVIIHLVLQRFGTAGLNFLSLLVGLVDIDPFLINLFEGRFSIPWHLVAVASMQAMISNNFVKMCYAIGFGAKKSYLYLFAGFSLVIILNIIIIFLI